MDWYYVTLTWDDWPEGGSYGTMVQAASPEGALDLAKREMAASRAEDLEGWGEDSSDGDAYVTWADEWHEVDCMKLEDFIRAHADKIDRAWLKPYERPVKEF